MNQQRYLPMAPCLYKIFDFEADAISLLETFRDEPGLFFLDSSLREAARGRYSFLGFDPFEVVEFTDVEGLENLREEFQKFYGPENFALTPFYAGIAGYLSYDWGLKHEAISRRPRDQSGWPEAFFGFYDCVLTVDHFARKLYVTSSGWPERHPSLRWKRAEERLERIGKKLSARRAEVSSLEHFNLNFAQASSLPWQCNFTKEEYCRAVERALDYIGRGDIYQVNLSQRFCFSRSAASLAPPMEIYKKLRQLSASPFAAYFDSGDRQILSSSPERFLWKKGRCVQTQPMKGTRPRGQKDLEDEFLRREITDSPKEKAELLMVTDLERNDLGKVCEYGSVHVKNLRAIEEYQTVFQSTSTVEGLLRKDKDAFDLLSACFPGGSVTGCPKIRAMRMIEELESVRRGPYTGSLGYVNFAGDMDFNILIRTVLVDPEQISFHAGGGIVADSTPEAEYEETLVKARAMRECLESVCVPQNFLPEKILH